MKRKPAAILTGDLEWRATVPECRTDDFFSEQTRKWQWLCALQEKYNCPVLDSGDVFDQWKSPPWLEVLALQNTPLEFYTVPGNHDLPGHNLENFARSSLAVLQAAGRAQVLLQPRYEAFANLYPFPWGAALAPRTDDDNGLPCVAMCHVMTYEGESPWPGCTDTEAKRLLRRMKGYDLVLTGHNHKPFVVELNGRLLVNPGSLMRTTADQADFQPRVYLWFADTNEVEPVFVPIQPGVVSRKHLDRKAQKDGRMAAFVDSLSGEYEVGARFEHNLEAFFANNQVRESVKNLVMGAVV